jgi:preprotein translocase SecF subunit
MVQFRQPPTADELRRALAEGGLGDATIQRYGPEGSGQFLIRARLRPEQQQATGQEQEEGRGKEILAALDGAYNQGEHPPLDLNQRGVLDIAATLLAADPLQLRASDEIAARQEYRNVADAIVEKRRATGVLADWSPLADVPQVTPEVRAALEQNAFLGNFGLLSQEVVGPTVGAELREQGMWAVVLSVLAMMGLIWLRYQLRFGIGAVIALVNNVLVVLGLYALLDFEFNLTTVAAFLTLVGYQVNDSVVVFDRIRETMRAGRRKRNFEQMLNDAVNQTLSRTLLTGGTVLAVLLAMLWLGGEVLRGFSFVMFAGILVGTYSSIWVASSFTLLWENWMERRRAAASPASEVSSPRASGSKGERLSAGSRRG